MQAQTDSHKRADITLSCLSRRELLILGGSTAIVITTFAPSETWPQAAQLVGSRYREKRIAKLSSIAADSPIEFDYPAKDMKNVLIKLGEIAGGGIGRDKDIVAFSALCTHMGGPLGTESYKPKYKVLGPCPLHLTTFDLTRYGMVVSGHATAALPQVMLELRGEDIVAVGMMGLVYGYAANPKA